MRSTGDRLEDEMREATLAAADHLDRTARAARQGTLRPSHPVGEPGADLLAALVDGRSGGTALGLTRLPDLLAEWSPTLGAVLRRRDGEGPPTPGFAVLTEYFRRDVLNQRPRIAPAYDLEHYVALADDAAIDPDTRLAALRAVPADHCTPAQRERLADAWERLRTEPHTPTARTPAARATLTRLTTRLAAASVLGHVEWAAADLRDAVGSDRVHAISHLVDRRVHELTAHVDTAAHWSARLLPHRTADRTPDGRPAPTASAARALSSAADPADADPDAARPDPGTSAPVARPPRREPDQARKPGKKA